MTEGSRVVRQALKPEDAETDKAFQRIAKDIEESEKRFKRFEKEITKDDIENGEFAIAWVLVSAPDIYELRLHYKSHGRLFVWAATDITT